MGNTARLDMVVAENKTAGWPKQHHWVAASAAGPESVTSDLSSVSLLGFLVTDLSHLGAGMADVGY